MSLNLWGIYPKPEPVGVNTGEKTKGEAMSEEQNTTAAESTTEESTQQDTRQDAQQQSPYKYTDDDVNRLKGSARKEAREAAQREIDRKYAEELGVPLDEAKAILQQAREAEEARQSDLEKANKQRQKLEQDHSKLQEELDGAYAYIAEMKQENALRGALTEAGVNPQRLPAALRLADTDMLEIDDDGNVTGVENAVSAIQEQSPEWFNGTRPKTSPDATRRERPVTGIWDMPKQEFEELQARAARGEKVTLPPQTR